MAAFCRSRGARATIVFDGHPLRDDMAAQDLGPVSLRVAPYGGDADTVIRELVERAPRAADLIVVTSDKPLYSYCRTLGATILRAHEWNALERQIAAGEKGGPQRRRDSSGDDKPDREVDVEGWLKKFGDK